MHKLFIYGTLRDPNVLTLVIGRPFPGPRSPAVLHGFRKRKVEGFDFPVIAPSPDGRVDGILIEGLTDEDITALDGYEDVSAGLYDRVEADVSIDEAGADAPRVRAFVYVAGKLLR